MVCCVHQNKRKSQTNLEREKMKIQKRDFSKIFALILLLSMTASMAMLPAQAHDPPWTVEAYCYAGVSPRIIGVGQQALIVFWINWVPPTVGVDSRYGDRWIYYVDLTAPDGSVKNLGPFKSDPVGGSYTTFTPTQVGTYKIVAKFPAYKVTGLPTASGIPVNSASVNDTYGPATSQPVYLTVQQQQIQPWQETSPPTRYWTRPITTVNRNWFTLADNWLGGAATGLAPGFSGYSAGGMFAFEPYAHGPGPESAHIMWTKPYYAGGIMDAIYGNKGYETAHYQGINLGNPIIIQGKLLVPYRNTAHTTTSWWVLDLYTGETLALRNDTMPAFGQVYDYESPNQHGGFPYLWRTSGVTLPEGYTTDRGLQTWELIDGFTLESVTKVANVSAGGSAVYGVDGSILRYNIVNLGTTANPKNYLQVWNSSAIPSMLLGGTGTNALQWRPAGRAVHDGKTGFSLNVSIPTLSGSIQAVRQDQYVIGGTSGKNNGTYVEKGKLWALNLDASKGAIGSVLWTIEFTPPLSVSDIVAGSGLTSYGVAFGPVDPEDGVFLFEHRLTLQRWGYSLATGQPLWGPSTPEEAFNFYGMSESIFNGVLITYGYSGQVRGYDVKTGKVLWMYNSTTVGFESPYAGLYPTGVAVIDVDGTLYCVSSEHSPTQPLWRGPNLRALDYATGQELWKILFWGARMSPTEPNVYLADGRLIGLNYYDMQLYCFGKGPSATTAEAPMSGVTLGQSVVIRGTVTDESLGAQEIASNAGFKNGVPAISDEDQSAWMEYLYMQQDEPANTKGVQVKLTATDPNGNYQNIGTAISDDLGNYAFSWAPPVTGMYTVRATFEGSKSYFGSEASTSFVVSQAAVAPAVVTPTPQPSATTPVTPITPTPAPTPISPTPTQAVIPPTSYEPTTTYIAISVIVVVLVVAFAVLIVRKRK